MQSSHAHYDDVCMCLVRVHVSSVSGNSKQSHSKQSRKNFAVSLLNAKWVAWFCEAARVCCEAKQGSKTLSVTQRACLAQRESVAQRECCFLG
jgi:hypothetical protein